MPPSVSRQAPASPRHAGVDRLDLARSLSSPTPRCRGSGGRRNGATTSSGAPRRSRAGTRAGTSRIAERATSRRPAPSGRRRTTPSSRSIPLLVRLLVADDRDRDLARREPDLRARLSSGRSFSSRSGSGPAWGEPRVFPSLLALLAFPTSFFFLSVYTESLALFLALLAVVSIDRSRPLLAAVLAGYLSGLTRITGVVLAPYLALSSMAKSRKEGRGWGRAILAGLLTGLPPILGFLTFCAYFEAASGTRSSS